MQQAITSMTDIFGPVISCYTQAEAIADGVLIPISVIASRHGFKIPTLITATLLTQLIGSDEAQNFQDSNFGVPLEIPMLFREIIQQIRIDPQQSGFKSETVSISGANQPFKVCMASNDDGEPCIIISLPEED